MASRHDFGVKHRDHEPGVAASLAAKFLGGWEGALPATHDRHDAVAHAVDEPHVRDERLIRPEHRAGAEPELPSSQFAPPDPGNIAPGRCPSLPNVPSGKSNHAPNFPGLSQISPMERMRLLS